MTNSPFVRYEKVGQEYFERRRLRRYAGAASLWALGVGAVISGHFAGWNLGLQYGWGSLFVATVIITVMYLGLTYSIAEMAPALPHTGGAYSFARSALGPWGGFITGVAENIEYVLTPAVIVFFIGSYAGAIVGTPDSFAPVYWILGYALFLALNLFGVELSFRVTVAVTLLALACLAFFYVSALPALEFSRNAMNVGVDASGAPILLPDGHGPWFPGGLHGVLAALPFAVWLYLAIEQLPLAAEESIDPRRDMPKGILLGMLTLIISAFAVLTLNVGLPPGSWGLKDSGEPLLDGFRFLFGSSAARLLAIIALTGLVASFHAIIFAFGRQIYSLSRAGYFPRVLSLTHGRHQTPHVALIAGAGLGLAVMLSVWFGYGEEHGGAFIGAVLLNMAVFGAMISYVMQALSFIVLRVTWPHLERPFRSPLGVTGAALALVIALVTLYFQLTDEAFRQPVLLAGAYYGLTMLHFGLIGRHRLVLSPEEEFAESRGQNEYRTH